MTTHPPDLEYHTPRGTRWEKEMAEAGGAHVFDLPQDANVLGPWILGDCVGRGCSGRVKIAHHAKTGQLAAVKILPAAPVAQSPSRTYAELYAASNHRLLIEKEITTLKLMKHPNIIRIYDVYETNTALYIVLEYVPGGELFDYLSNNGRLDEDTTWAIFRQIIHGLNYAHTFSIIHRDLKLENILMASFDPPLVKIVDWGMAAFAHPSLVLETSCGSPHYASPEIARGDPYQGTATDIWSCGVILYALVVGYLPFDDKDVAAIIRKVTAGRYEVPSDINPQIQDLLSRMLVVDAKHRITIPDILMHPWVAAPPHGHHLYQWPDPPLPPSPSQLARPIASRDLIDPELLQSLRIIWGRYSDSEGKSITRDLCSPPGYGEHAKAFYYLLGNHREEEWRLCFEDSLDDDVNNSQPNSLRCSRFTVLSPRLSGIDEKTCVTQSERAISNYRFSSKNSALGSCSEQANIVSSVSMTPYGHRTLRGCVSHLSLDHVPQRGRKGHKSFGASPNYPHSKGNSFQTPCSWERFPKDMQTSGQVGASTTTSLNTPSPSCSNDNEAKKYLCRCTSTYLDKENCVPESWKMPDVEDARDSTGRTSTNKILSTKLRLNKLLPLEFSRIRRRNLFSTSPMDITYSSSRFNFPLPVDELKGWFSSHFSWKARSGSLLSHQGVSRTCAEVRKALEELGGRVEHSCKESWPDCQTLRCRIGYLHHQVKDNNLKPTCFRVELSILPPAISYQIPIRSSTIQKKTYNSSSHSPDLQSSSQERSQERQLCRIFLVHEKGSTSSFKSVLRILKETYGKSIQHSDNTLVAILPDATTNRNVSL